MADSPDFERTMSPMELYEKLTAQGDQVRALKTAKADNVSTTELNKIFICLLTALIPRTTYSSNLSITQLQHVNVLCQQQVNCTGVPHIAHSKMPFKKKRFVNSIWEMRTVLHPLPASVEIPPNDLFPRLRLMLPSSCC